MKRFARLAFTAGLAAMLFTRGGMQAAFATPFSDVPANHWAYQYIQSLAADGIIDGYPDGKFKGDRPLTRYEMAVVVARVIAKLQENQGPKGPSKEDLDKLQKLIDALKDELDALGVRVTNLEDSLDALDKRTKFAQSLSLHGVLLPNLSLRQRPYQSTSIVNTTGAAVSTYYGASAPCSPGVNGCAANNNPTAVTTVDPFVTAFVITDDSNNPLTQAGSAVYIRQDDRFSLAYAITDGLTVSLPVHVLTYEQGGEFSTNQHITLEPGVDVTVAKTGNISNLNFKFGYIDNMQASLAGLAFKPPVGDGGSTPYELSPQPTQKGFGMSGTIGEGAFGSTDFQGSFTRVENTLIDTIPGATDPSIIQSPGAITYFLPVVVANSGYTQTTPSGSLATNTFNAGGAILQQVYLSAKAVDGSVYISYYNGATYNNAGTQTGGPTTIAAPGFTYNDQYNSVVFATPLPAGSVVTITYKSLGVANTTSAERYMVHARLNQKFKGYDGLQIGLNCNRIFDFTDVQTTGQGATGLTFVNRNPVSGIGLVSDTVLGLDFQAPIPYEISGPGSKPVIFGEVADSKYTADYRNTAAVGDTAGLIGLRFKIQKVELSAQYQSVGANFFAGAPFHYYGNAPPLFAFYKLAYLPDFFGFANNLGINKQFDSQFTNLGLASPNTAGNPNLTFAFPAFNTLKASGPEYFSSFAPDSRGLTTSINAPIRIGDFNFTARGGYSHLFEINPNSLGGLLYGPGYQSNKVQNFDTYSAGASFALPVFGQKANVNLNGSYETLKRLDTTAYQYYPINPATEAFDGTAFALANAAFPVPAAGSTNGTPYNGGSNVSFYPNYENMKHITITAAAALPLTTNLTLNGTYSTQRYGGEFGTTLGQNVSERKDYYTGGLTYSIPKTNSSVTFSAKRYQYTDDVLPTYNFAQNRQDVNFTVRF
jgi:hypothetical protein